MAGLTATASLTWTGDLRFDATAGSSALVLDGRREAGPSPIDALAMAIAGCMAIDVVDIVKKGRHDLRGLETRITAERAADPPRRFVSVALHFVVDGPVPEAAVERALELSREKYCSVWQTCRQDIPLAMTFEIRD